MIYIESQKGNMPHNDNEIHNSPPRQLSQFRQELRACFNARSEATMNLLDALASNTAAKSVVELSLNPCFPHQYRSVYDAIENFLTVSDSQTEPAERRAKELDLMRLCVPYLPVPKQRDFWLFGLDVTPQPRPFAKTLADRTIVYQPNTVLSNKPITIGHQYAALVCFPDKASVASPPWAIPLSIRRVGSQEKATNVQAQQIASLLTEEAFPLHNDLSVCVVDSTLSAIPFLGPVKSIKNLVTIARCRSNRVFYHRPAKATNKRGHPLWYGARFDLKDASTSTSADQTTSIELTTRRGRTLKVVISAWYNLLMRGTREYPMHDNPFTLIRIHVNDVHGKPVFQHPLWLVVIGEKRDHLSLKAVWAAYLNRYDVEHFFRFGKQRLLTTAYQTPEVSHEENWWQLTQLAYMQLWLARQLAETMPRPWERYLPQFHTTEASPSLVQRDFGRIIRQIEPPPSLPKPRGKSPGRAKGVSVNRREKQKIIIKTKKRLKSAA